MALADVDVRPQYAVALIPVVMEVLIAAQGDVLRIAMLQPAFSRTQRVRECRVVNGGNVVLPELDGVVACELEFFTVDPTCAVFTVACQ